MAEFNMEKNYNPAGIEDRIYADWSNSGCFAGEVNEGGPMYSMVIPPPNITGQLHMGHALDNTWQDILARYKRMSGYQTLWLPGTDHASIATEVKIVAAMAKEGLTKADIGRDEFLKRAWEWTALYGGRIVSQLKKLGSSLDWSRERFTMDEGCNRAVRTVFVNLYNKGLIYRGNRIVNWCPCCKTSISDAEVEYEEENGFFWHINYPIVGEEGRFVTIATTRPETLLGDSAVAVNPKDERYTDLVGKQLVLPLTGRTIPVIADDYVDKEFGTGCVKITPAHDPNDFQVGKRHNLPELRVLNDDGTINELGGKYAGMDRLVAREAIVNDLKELGLLVKVEPHVHSVGHCYRCHTTIEPLTSLQWFVDMKPLAAPAIEAVKDGSIRFIPERFEKNYLNWMENIQDWCISRQLWWGHRIPAYYCDDCGEVIVAYDEPACCPKCGGKLRQDEDVLDTWFSSALWPFSTLGWPDNTEDLKKFYPTSTLVTGYDIITFWVSRMIFSGIEHMGEKPFSDVLIHGLVRDAQGRKMSKSLGNGIDPLEVIDKYGADALRASLVTGNSPGNDMRFTDEKVEASRNFANKLWNASRFILMNMAAADITDPKPGKPEAADEWILSRANEAARDVSASMDSYDLGVALQKATDFIWDEFCDWYIELSKPRLYSEDMAAKEQALNTLLRVLKISLKLMHPFMPFITEEIWSYLPKTDDDNKFIMLSSWPVFDEKLYNLLAERKLTALMESIKAIRNLRAEMNVPVSRKTKIYISLTNADDSELRGFIAGEELSYKKLAFASEIELTEGEVPGSNAVLVTGDLKLIIPMGELVDYEKEAKRLSGELDKLDKEISRAEGKLSNQGFIAKAPAKLVEEEKEKLERFRQMREHTAAELAKIQEQL